MKTDTPEPKTDKVDVLIAEDRLRTERRKLMLQELLQEASDRKGHVLAHRSAMGRALTNSGSPKLVPSYAATHTLEWIAANIKLGSEMPFMKSKIDEEGRLQIDAENSEDVKQRAPDWTRQPALTAYLAQSVRKFGPIIAVVSPAWVDTPKHENWSKGRALKSATDFTPLDVEGKVGLLNLEDVHVYALDGQHRVIGIQGMREVRDKGGLIMKKKEGAHTAKVIPTAEFLKMFKLSIEELQALLSETMLVEYIPAVIAGETRDEASRRIRSTFISINSYAKRTDKGENILLDDMDGYAIVARKAGLFHPLFDADKKNNRVNWKNTSIPNKRTTWYTTLQTIHEMASSYLSATNKVRADDWDIVFKEQMPMRPPEPELDAAKQEFFAFLDQVFNLPVFQELERGDIDSRPADVQRWRDFPTEEEPANKGHLLLRPLGQIILARAVGTLMRPKAEGGKGMSLDAIFKKLKRFDEAKGFEAHRPGSVWYGVTFDPKEDKMIMGNLSWAPQLLVYLVSGLDEQDRQNLWQEFVMARVINKVTGTWRNLDGKEVQFDVARQGLPAPI